MVAQLYYEEQVKRIINREDGLLGQILWSIVNYSAGRYFRQTPDDWFGRRGIYEFNQGLDILRRQFVLKSGHLRGDASVTDHADRGRFAQALEIAG